MNRTAWLACTFLSMTCVSGCLGDDGAGGVAATGGSAGFGGVGGGAAVGGVAGIGGIGGVGGVSGTGGSSGAQLGDACDWEDCATDLVCVPGLLSSGFLGGPAVAGCSRPCASDGECGSYVCGIGPDGSDMCVPPCTGLADFVCIDGESVSCAVAGDTHCEICGCGGLRCEPGVGCMPLSGVGGPCADDSECNTGNCSYYAGVCRVPIGQPCDASNCDNCWAQGDYSFCGRPCRSSDECNGELCIGDSFYDEYDCSPRCTSSCPGQCRYLADYSDQYCWCPDCTHTSAPRQVGNICSYDSQCTSGSCYTGPTACDDFFTTCEGETGLCTLACADDTECSNGTRCVEIACAPGETDTCGNKCLPACADDWDCAVGHCQPLSLIGSSAGGASVAISVCGQKAEDGRGCTLDRHCLSNNCAASACAPTGGAANGSDCNEHDECMSRSCVSGQCQGNGLIGDPCAVPADCAVGTCCPSGMCGTNC